MVSKDKFMRTPTHLLVLDTNHAVEFSVIKIDNPNLFLRHQINNLI